MQSLLTAETLPTLHGKPSEDPNIFLTSFNCYATAAGWSHQYYILHFEGQLHDNADIIHRFLKQEQTKGGVLLISMEAKTQLLNCFRHRDQAIAKIMKLGNLWMNVEESVDAWNLLVRTVLQETFLTDFSKTQVLEKFIAGAVLDLKEKFLQDWEGRRHVKKSLDHWSKSSRQERNSNDSSSGNDKKKKRPFCYNCKSREHWTRECSEKKHVNQSKKKDTFDGALRDTKDKSGSQSQVPTQKDSTDGRTGSINIVVKNACCLLSMSMKISGGRTVEAMLDFCATDSFVKQTLFPKK
ncbi:hypothetical protein QOT17_025124 [Balamuthia mandrillaris]